METKETRTSRTARPKNTGQAGTKRKMTKEEAKRAAQARQQAKLKAESRERAKRRAERKAKEREERAQRIEAGRRRSAERSQRRQTEKKNRRPIRTPRPEVVYTAPKPISRNVFLLRLATVVAVVFALTFGISIFFQVETVNVSGTQIYTAWDVMEASGVKKGDNLLGLSKAKLSGRITAALPYVESVRIGLQLPGTLNIEVTESDVLYAIAETRGDWWLVTAAGRVVDRTIQDSTYTKILGVKLEAPTAGEQAVAAELSAQEDTIRDSDRLTLALTIAENLERSGIIGVGGSINVENTGAMELWYADQYLVKLGDSSRLDHKISCLKAAVEQMADYRNGVLDISFTTWQDEVSFTPFSDN